ASPVVAEAIDAIRSEAPRVEESLRAAAARSVAALPLPLGLLEYFASDSLTVSAPVLAAATLDRHQWEVVHRAADRETRSFIATLHPEVGVEPEDEAAPGIVASGLAEEAGAAPTYTPPSLHEVVERIERRRRKRTGESQTTPDEASPAEPPALFRWECGPGGEIAWVEGAPRGPLIGRSIARPHDTDRIDRDVIRAFGMRAPFRDGSLTVASAGPVSGEWKISGVPAFDPADGRFAGYRGVALREAPAPATSEAFPEVLADPDSLRELVHEIKTPLNAIIGFAEIIEGQFLGPADRGYRDRAAEIVRQARLLLTAIDDLDFAAKVHSASGPTRERVDLGTLIEREAPELRGVAATRGVEVMVTRPRSEVAAAVQPELADRLSFRLFEALAGQADQGERIQLAADAASGSARLTISRPRNLRGVPDSDLFDSGGGAGVEGGFALRLVRGLARIAGGDLVGTRDAFALVFPRG
ncbi:MAG TPA: histidine kinase dimerization/phospho-acceptor domain-containing protein, partial [Sphingomicrobium sp.]|nr:histidine kinase dimerization/phospho-acceptor domain-containing protein [Sphingomicrobium sp.]